MKFFGKAMFGQREPSFTPLKTIKLGTGPKTGADFLKAIKETDCIVGCYGEDMLKQHSLTASSAEVEVDLVVASNRELGFKDGAILQDTYERILDLGGELCSSEDGPQVQLQHIDHPRIESFFLAMKPITGSDGHPYIFSIRRIEGASQWFGGSDGTLNRFWDADTLFVFRRPKTLGSVNQ